MSTTMTTAVERYQPVMSEAEQTTLLGFLAGYRGYAATPTRWICASSPPGAGSVNTACSRFAASISNASPASSRTAARLGRRWRAGCARSSGSTATPRRKASSSIPGRAHPPTTHRLRVPRRPPRPQRARGDPRHRRPVVGPGPRFGVAAGIERFALSEAVGANIEALGLERGHRTLTVLRKGGKLVTMPLAPRVARAVDSAVGERLEGPIYLG